MLLLIWSQRQRKFPDLPVLFEVALSKLAQPQRIALNYAQKRRRGCRGYVRTTRAHVITVSGGGAFVPEAGGKEGGWEEGGKETALQEAHGVVTRRSLPPCVMSYEKREIIRLYFLQLSDRAATSREGALGERAERVGSVRKEPGTG